ncbi:MAG: CiaD-like domain-containing protein, partial [Campylobacterales bacterium]
MAGKSMDMKDLVLSTLSYLEKSADEDSIAKAEATSKSAPTIKEIPTQQLEESQIEELKSKIDSKETEVAQEIQPQENTMYENDKEELLRFMTTLRERILVLFEGLQSPNNRNIEAKIDLILNFLEYQLSLIDNKIEEINAKEYEAKRYS